MTALFLALYSTSPLRPFFVDLVSLLFRGIVPMMVYYDCTTTGNKRNRAARGFASLVFSAFAGSPHAHVDQQYVHSDLTDLCYSWIGRFYASSTTYSSRGRSTLREAAKKVKVGTKMLQALPLQEMGRILTDAGYIIQAPA